MWLQARSCGACRCPRVDSFGKTPPQCVRFLSPESTHVAVRGAPVGDRQAAERVSVSG